MGFANGGIKNTTRGISMLEDKQLESVKQILGNLYIKYGLTEEVVRLSQLVDEVVVKIQKEKYMTMEEKQHVNAKK